jgi:hypothetical protein
MAQLAVPLMIAGTAVSAGSSILGGLYANSAGKAMQKQYKNQANTERAVAQRQGIKDHRESQLTESRAIAVGAASGAGGVETEGFSNIVAGINEQGYMNYMTSIWNGENKAQGLIYQGKIARAEGKQKKQAGFLQAATTVLSSASSIAGGMGGGGMGGASYGATGSLR